MQQLQNETISEEKVRVSPDRCAQEVLAAVPAIMRFIRSQMRQHRQSELSVPQFRALVVLSQHEDVSLSMLAEHLGLSLPAVSRMAELLVRRELMERRTRPSDRRGISLSLTAKGKETFQKSLAATEIAMTQNLKKLSEQEIASVSVAAQILNRLFTPGKDSSELMKG